MCVRPITNTVKLKFSKKITKILLLATFTSIMPDIKGIIPLIYMIFAPRKTMRYTTNERELEMRNRQNSYFNEKVGS